MALDPTPGASTANSFLSLSRAEELAAGRLYTDVWDAASDPLKERALIMATSILRRECFLGTRVNGTTQALPFPRANLTTPDGFLLPSDTIPLEIELATFELALMLLSSDVTQESSAAVQGITKIKAGSVEIGFRNDIEAKGLPDNVRRLIPESWFCPKAIGRKPEVWAL